MQPFTTHRGLAIPLDRANIDTDAIIPKQFLKSIYKTGFGPHLFDEWRYLDKGELGMDNEKRPLNMDFPLNKPEYQGGSVLLTRDNFGCGSSREHAVWALAGFGFRAVISSSYSDIFYNNCFKNGFLPVRLTLEEIETLFVLAKEHLDMEIMIDLPEQIVTPYVGDTLLHEAFHFDIDKFRKDSLIKGLDEIGITLQHAAEIRAYEKERMKRAPWIFNQLR